MTTRLVKILPKQTYNSAVKACEALVEHERLRSRVFIPVSHQVEQKRLADDKLKEALAHAKKVIAACEGK